MMTKERNAECARQAFMLHQEFTPTDRDREKVCVCVCVRMREGAVVEYHTNHT